VKRVIRTVYVWACIAIFTIVLASLAFVTCPFDKRGNVVHSYARLWGRLILAASRTDVNVTGLEHIRPGLSYVFVCNHLSSFDIFSLLGYLPVQFRWVAKAELFRIPILGWAMRAAGYISLDRSGRRRAHESMELAARKIREGTSVVMFPEGSRSLGGRLQPFMKGAFTLAIRAGVPLLPVTIDGTWQIMPRSTLRISKGSVKITVSAPIATEGLTMKDRDALSKKVERVIRMHLHQKGEEAASAA
jgi:1-acyl-sn-glycerol-3-phosphate acyltransferase